MSNRNKIIIAALVLIVLAIAAYFIFRKKKVVEEAPVINEGAKVIGGKSITYVPNKFPLEEGMQGDYVLALQRALNRIRTSDKIAEDGIFGPSTRTKLLLTVSSSQSVLPMSGAAWQQIIIDSNK
jgi:hypothetical protein